jgi:hypothetical protein
MGGRRIPTTARSMAFFTRTFLGTKIYFCSTHPPPDFTLPYGIFFGLEISIQQLKVGGGLAMFILSLRLPLELAMLFLLFTLFINKYCKFFSY